MNELCTLPAKYVCMLCFMPPLYTPYFPGDKCKSTFLYNAARFSKEHYFRRCLVFGSLPFWYEYHVEEHVFGLLLE